MNELLNKFFEKITGLSTSLTGKELSAIQACMHDYIKSISKIENSLKTIVGTEDKDIIQEELAALQIEFVNHIKPQIISAEAPLLKLVNELE